MVKSHSEGFVQSICDGMKRAVYFTLIDAALSFRLLEIAAKDKRKTAFQDAHGTLWELNR